MKNFFRPAIALFIGLSLITGIAYPLLATAIGKAMHYSAELVSTTWSAAPYRMRFREVS